MLSSANTHSSLEHSREASPMREPVKCRLLGGVSDLSVVLQEVERERGMGG